MGRKTSVAAGSYEDVLVIAESSETEIDALRLKYYAPGVGNVRVGWIGKDEKTIGDTPPGVKRLFDPYSVSRSRASSE